MLEWMPKNRKDRRQDWFHLQNKIVKTKKQMNRLRGFMDGLDFPLENRAAKREECECKMRELEAILETTRETIRIIDQDQRQIALTREINPVF